MSDRRRKDHEDDPERLLRPAEPPPIGGLWDAPPPRMPTQEEYDLHRAWRGLPPRPVSVMGEDERAAMVGNTRPLDPLPDVLAAIHARVVAESAQSGALVPRNVLDEIIDAVQRRHRTQYSLKELRSLYRTKHPSAAAFVEDEP